MELTERVTQETRDATSVLVLRPQLQAGSDSTCKRLLVGDSRPVHLLGICFSTSPTQWYDQWEQVLGGPPADAAVITTPDSFVDDKPDGLVVETVGNPSDVTGIGMQATKYLNSWEEDDATVVVALDSLTLMLQYVSLETLYRFLHVLTRRLDVLGATGLFFLDPSAQDQKTVNTLKTLFHGVLSYEEQADDWQLRTQ
ncbi:hypothetical protein GL213_00310 [Halogeometricum borinquense]|uniref:Recombinase RecA n=1 Tax=Halogeometricum borinquense TaxID=60847 RepID=A0A6C0UEF9_9EURY|nr:hypothetical protein [Halogeometricum borinquense]QIB72923.1 hypothetical protein G3I44_00645 [Halogeometricum borinquense]QIQ75118.1 hypothetical protein GL213_00310 [Halogeometricum borinquense]